MYGGVGANYYYLPGVKWVQYFYQEYSFHGTYWHNNFGRPMSHGCLNMTNADAKWLFDWAGPVWDGKTTWYKSSEENPGTLIIITP
ncbi:MAG: L,D-transpeptidase [Caldilineaceae bacterium]